MQRNCFIKQETQHYGTVLRLHDVVGIVAIACPDESPLLSFISLVAPAIVRGNTVVVVPSEKYPLPAVELYQVCMRDSYSVKVGMYVKAFIVLELPNRTWKIHRSWKTLDNFLRFSFVLFSVFDEGFGADSVSG